MKSLFTFLLLTLSLSSFSQEKGSMYLRIFPKDAIIKLNDSLLQSRLTYTLDSGDYMLKIWLPKREFVEKKVSIFPGKTTQVLEVLEYTRDYRIYRRRLFMYRVNKSLMRYGSIAFVGWFVQNTVSTLGRLNDKVTRFYDKSVEAKNDYDTGVEILPLQNSKSYYELNKLAYEQSLEEYNNSKRNRVIASGALLVSVVALEYFSFKLKKPVFEEKVLLSSVYMTNYNNQWVPSFSLTYKF